MAEEKIIKNTIQIIALPAKVWGSFSESRAMKNTCSDVKPFRLECRRFIDLAR
ncbi:MAG: hypothetical protein IPI30_22380 [Saprospiraceae bacterium]|nr:hypothetical protein [Candidatus Vicinibacter affinis]